MVASLRVSWRKHPALPEPWPVPERDAGEDVVDAIVGKMKQGNRKFVYWRKRDGTQYGKNTCTWEVIDAKLDKDDLEGESGTYKLTLVAYIHLVCAGKQARFKLRQTIFNGIIKHKSDSEDNVYWVEFNSRRHANKFVDLELPKAVGDGEYSWWRLDGYDTNEDEDESMSEE